MSRGKGRAAWAAAALLVAAAGSGCGAPAPAPAPIEIMVVGAFQGPGQGALRSVRLAVDMADRKGGVLGHPVLLLEADDGGAAGAAVAAAERACTDLGVVAVISGDSGAALGGISRVLFGCGLPLIVTSGAEPPPSFTNVFRLLGTPAEQGALIGSWMEMKLHPGQVYLVGEASDPELEGV
ncbi:MAG: ABC transporter substrate-binding protein, partial [Candidatus Dormibacterales bacterium]